MRRWLAWIAVLFAWSVAMPAPAQEPQVDDVGRAPVEVRPGKVMMRARPFADGLIRTNRWTSLQVTIANGADPTRATVSIESRGIEEGGAQRYERQIELPRGARKDVVLFYQPGIGGQTRTANVVVGAEPMTTEYPVHLLGDHDVGIAVIGDDTLGINAVPDAWSGPVPGRRVREWEDSPRRVRVGLVPLASMPESSFGWDAMDWVVWSSPNPSSVDARRLEALRAWVADGGHLFVTVSDDWRSVAGSPLGEMLPVELTGVRDSDALGPFLHALGGTPGDPTPTPVAQATLLARPSGHALALATIEDEGEVRPLWVAGSYGLGTVHVLLADPRVSPITRDIARADLWRALLWLPDVDANPQDLFASLARPGANPSDEWHTWRWELGGYGWYFPDYTHYSDPRRRLFAELDMAAPSPDDFYVQGESHYTLSNSWYYDTDAALAWESEVRKMLSDIPGVAPLPLSWLVLFSVLYLLVIGPIDYFVLKWLGRQPLTWVTFPLSIAVFSAVALVGTSMVKGNQAVVTRLEVIDVFPDTMASDGGVLWRGDTYLGVWATRKARMSLRSEYDNAMVRPLREAGSMWDRSVVSTEGSNELRWRAETWTLAYVRSSWVEEQPGTVWVEALPGGDGWRIHNDLGMSLASARLVARRTSLDLGPIKDGGHVDLSGASTARGVDLRALEQAVVARGSQPYPTMDMLDLDWSIYEVTEHPEWGRGHLDLHGQVALVGATQEPFEPIDLSGIKPVTRATTVFRVPLMAKGESSP